MRINIVGSGGSGKTTLAVAIAQTLRCPHIELDALHWGPNWTEIPLAEFRASVSAAIQADQWVIDWCFSQMSTTPRWVFLPASPAPVAQVPVAQVPIAQLIDSDRGYQVYYLFSHESVSPPKNQKINAQMSQG